MQEALGGGRDGENRLPPGAEAGIIVGSAAPFAGPLQVLLEWAIRSDTERQAGELGRPLCFTTERGEGACP